MNRAALLATVLMLGSTASAQSVLLEEPPPRPTPFDQGRFGISLGGGTSSNFGERYTAIGGGVGYYVLDGLQIGLSFIEEFGSGPNLFKLSPNVQYVAQPLVYKWPLVPYVGAFFNHWFVGDNIADVNTVGGRLGLLYVGESRVVIGGGIAVERIVSQCDKDCTDVYPDFVIALSF
ncbi:MAG TPA: hypothetical protein VGM90_00045 [Kofleriaceae bacterium]